MKNLIRSKILAHTSERGFSLIEVLVTITLIAVGAALISGQIFDRLEEGNIKAAQIQIRSLAQQLDDYRRICQQYPSTQQGLEALIAKPTEGDDCKAYPEHGFIKGKLPMDPWSYPYNYESDTRTFRITSYGKRGQPGGTGAEADIKSDEL